MAATKGVSIVGMFCFQRCPLFQAVVLYLQLFAIAFSSLSLLLHTLSIRDRRPQFLHETSTFCSRTAHNETTYTRGAVDLGLIFDNISNKTYGLAGSFRTR
jgi:hypothetical protein